MAIDKQKVEKVVSPPMLEIPGRMEMASVFIAGGSLMAMLCGSAVAGEESSSHASIAYEQAEPVPYEAGRGLITTEGPSGMFINPTSGVLPHNAFTLQYCFLLPNNDSSVVGHGALLAYGLTDWFEIGATGNYIDIDGADDLTNAGPFAKIRLLKNDVFVPQVTIGGYTRFGDEAREQYSAYSAAYWRVPIAEDGFVKALGIHAGARHTWAQAEGAEDLTAGYAGLELQFPYRFYLVGEIQTKDNEEENPYSFGMQWRLGGINISVAGVQTGNLDEPGFYFGIGSAVTF